MVNNHRLVVWNMNLMFPFLVGMMIQSDFHIFQGGGSTTNLFELEVEDWIISIKQLDFMIFRKGCLGY